jgi:glycosyltransferase 2 family protein
MRGPVMDPPASTGRARGRRWSFARVLLVAGGLLLVALFVSRVGADRVATELARAGPSALWLLVPYVAGTAIGAFPFALLLPPSLRPTTWALVQGRFAASTANALLPFFGVMGEPSRLLWLPAEGQARGVAAILVDRILYNAANGLILVGGAAVAGAMSTLPATLVAGALVIGVLTLATTAGGLFVVARFGVGRRLQALMKRALGERYSAHPDFGADVDGFVVEVVRGPKGRLVQGVAVHLVSRALLALEVAAGLLVLHAGASTAQAIILAVVPIALSFVFSSIPSQIGVQEGAQTLVAGAIGLDPTLVLAVVLLQRARQLVFAALLPFLLAGARSAPHQREMVNVP